MRPSSAPFARQEPDAPPMSTHRIDFGPPCRHGPNKAPAVPRPPSGRPAWNPGSARLPLRGDAQKARHVSLHERYGTHGGAPDAETPGAARAPSAAAALRNRLRRPAPAAVVARRLRDDLAQLDGENAFGMNLWFERENVNLTNRVLAERHRAARRAEIQQRRCEQVVAEASDAAFRAEMCHKRQVERANSVMLQHYHFRQVEDRVAAERAALQETRGKRRQSARR